MAALGVTERTAQQAETEAPRRGGAAGAGGTGAGGAIYQAGGTLRLVNAQISGDGATGAAGGHGGNGGSGGNGGNGAEGMVPTPEGHPAMTAATVVPVRTGAMAALAALRVPALTAAPPKAVVFTSQPAR